MNFLDRIQTFLEQTSYTRALPKCDSIYVIGKNSESLNTAKYLTVEGIIDDYSNQDEWNGIPIVKSDRIDRNCLLINCSTSISPVSVGTELAKKGFKHIINYSELVRIENSNRLPLPSFCTDTIEDVKLNHGKWNALYELLNDGQSKKILEDLLLFRLSADPQFMQDYSVCIQKQYMEDFMQYHNEIMVDAGAFDGDTTDIFSQHYPSYKCIHLFEPSNTNLENAKRRLYGKANIVYHAVGLSNKSDIKSFDSLSGSSSKICDGGDSEIVLGRLDDLITENITFLKMDIEGWEIPALEGSKNHIKNNHPKLAISVYHTATDFWRTPEVILSYRDDYDVYLRHYTEGWSETIMYFKPKK